MRRRSSFRNALEYASVRLVVSTLAHAPKPLADRLARIYAKLLDLAIPRLRRTAMENLRRAVPELPEDQRRRVVDGVFHSIARILVTFSRFPHINKANVHEWIRYEGFEHFQNALRAGKGVLFATAHLGNWELSAYAHALMAGPMLIMVRPLDNPRIDALVARYRGLSGNSLIEKKEFLRGVVKALHANQAVGILIDQDAGLDEGVFVDFFGRKASASAGFAKLAARTGAAVIPGYALWSEAEGKYVLRFDAPIPITGDAHADTQAIQSHLEAVIREHPDQWLWIHRRWKTRPAEESLS